MSFSSSHIAKGLNSGLLSGSPAALQAFLFIVLIVLVEYLLNLVISETVPLRKDVVRNIIGGNRQFPRIVGNKVAALVDAPEERQE